MYKVSVASYGFCDILQLHAGREAAGSRRTQVTLLAGWYPDTICMPQL